ncbi:MAG: alpha/beta hydrolase [Ketobacter sp.]|nr:MAG: alpha/beta hydrolase [Ketobacter sp.]
MDEIKMPIVTLSSGVVSYTEMGHGAPILLLHANPGDQRDFAAVMEPLSRHGRVLALDWPGNGQSPALADPEKATVDVIYRVLEEFVTTLGLKDLLLIGNSLGGNAAVRLAAHHPQWVSGLVLVAPGGFTPQNALSRAFCRWQGSRFSLSPYRFARFYLKRKTAITSAMLDRAQGAQSEPDALAMNRALWRSFGRPENDLSALADQVLAPCLLLFGQYDPVIKAYKDGDQALRFLPHARREVLSCGHAPFAEVPEQFLQSVYDFLPQLKRTSRRATESVTMGALD